jgi:hypothetical protein
MDEQTPPTVGPRQAVPPTASSPGLVAVALHQRLEHAANLIDDGAQACEEMRSLGYEFGLEREPQIKVPRFLDRLDGLVALLTSANGSESARVADSLGEAFGRLLGLLQADRGFVQDARGQLSESNTVPDSLLDLYVRTEAVFIDRAKDLEAAVNDCREIRARLRQDAEFSDAERP